MTEKKMASEIDRLTLAVRELKEEVRRLEIESKNAYGLGYDRGYAMAKVSS